VAINPELVERAIAEISKRRANYEYFFERLSSPEWITPLKQRGLFDDPPSIQVGERGIWSPSWPPSQFLARVAPHDPEQVLEVMLAVHTPNERVHADFAEAAASMPASLARRWAERELDWLREGRKLYSFELPRKLVDLIEKLGSEGEIDIGLSLADELFRPLPTTSEVRSQSVLGLVIPRFLTWDYDELVHRVVQSLLDPAPEATVQLLVMLLAQVISLATSDRAESDEDYSGLWRPRVADEERDDRGIQQALVSRLRDVAVSVREQVLVADARLIELLSGGGTRVFHRIGAFALSRPPLADPMVSARILVDRKYFFESEPSPEYRELLGAAFRGLDVSSRDTLLSWIAEGPNLEEYRDYRSRVHGELPNSAEVERYAATWRIRRLQLIRENLPKEWRRQYEELIGRFGESEFITSFEVSAWRGPESPIGFEELSSRSDKDLISFLESYESESSWFGPSREGLARTLCELAEANSERISRLAPQLAMLPPIYVQWALIGLGNAIRSGSQVAWQPLVELLEQVVRPREEEHIGIDEDNYGRWSWVRQQVATILDTGFRSTVSSIPFNLRRSVWRVLEPLTSDPEPTTEYEERYGGSNMDPATLALNTIRGHAMHAVVSYALWVHRAIEGQRDKSGGQAGFEAMPEVRRVLDHHIDPGRDPSIAVRSVYGQRFPWLVLLDETWAASASRRIFPDDPMLRTLKYAAWYSYLIFCQPYDHVFQLLRPQYSDAVNQLGDDPPSWRWIGGNEAPERGLAGHLLSFYWRGRLELHEKDELIERFSANATLDSRIFAIHLLGRALHDTEQLNEDVRERIERFWEWRIHNAERNRRNDQLAEIAAFASWADANALDSDWRLAQLERILALGASLEHEVTLLSALRALAHDHPLRSIRVLRQYLTRERDRWAIEAGREEIESILRSCLASENLEVATAAEDLVHWLGSLGYRSFRDLLGNGPS